MLFYIRGDSHGLKASRTPRPSLQRLPLVASSSLVSFSPSHAVWWSTLWKYRGRTVADGNLTPWKHLLYSGSIMGYDFDCNNDPFRAGCLAISCRLVMLCCFQCALGIQLESILQYTCRGDDLILNEAELSRAMKIWTIPKMSRRNE